MGEIPEDVKKAAFEIWASMPYGGVLEAIEQAILAERQRCADVAKANAHADCDVAEQIERHILVP